MTPVENMSEPSLLYAFNVCNLRSEDAAMATKGDCWPVGLTRLQSRERLLLGDQLSDPSWDDGRWVCDRKVVPGVTPLPWPMTEWAKISARSACNQPESIVKARSGSRIRWSTWSNVSQHWTDQLGLICPPSLLLSFGSFGLGLLLPAWPNVTWPRPIPIPIPTLIFSPVFCPTRLRLASKKKKVRLTKDRRGEVLVGGNPIPMCQTLLVQQSKNLHQDTRDGRIQRPEQQQ